MRINVMVFALGVCIARAGQLAEARRILEPILSEVAPIYQATIYTALGQKSVALDTLEKAHEAHSDWMYSVVRHPLFGEYHSHPRFVRLLEHLGLSKVAGSNY